MFPYRDENETQRTLCITLAFCLWEESEGDSRGEDRGREGGRPSFR